MFGSFARQKERRDGRSLEMRSAALVDEVMHEATAKEVVEGNANGLISDVAEGQALEEIATIENREALTPEEECLWDVVEGNSADFNSWTVLIHETGDLFCTPTRGNF